MSEEEHLKSLEEERLLFHPEMTLEQYEVWVQAQCNTLPEREPAENLRLDLEFVSKGPWEQEKQESQWEVNPAYDQAEEQCQRRDRERQNAIYAEFEAERRRCEGE